MSIRILLSICCALLVSSKGVTQSNGYQLGLLPALNLNTKTGKGYRLNAKLESRNTFYQMSSLDVQYELTDVSLVVSKRMGVNNALGMGYLMRIDNGELIHRFIQQYNLVTSGNRAKWGHRFLLDQTLIHGAADTWRLRYRLSGLFPLTGESIDPEEFYLKLQNEYLNIFRDAYNLEIRTNVFLGYKFSDANKFEFGMDNRFRNLVANGVSVQSWLRMSWYLAI